MRRDVFQAIADPVRRNIIGLLAHQSLNVGSIAEQFDISRPAISKQIKILKECGLVGIEKQGRESVCRLLPERLHEVDEWIAEFRRFWDTSFDQLDDVLSSMKSIETNHE